MLPPWVRQRRQGCSVQEVGPFFHCSSGPASAGTRSCGRGVWLRETHPVAGVSSQVRGENLSATAPLWCWVSCRAAACPRHLRVSSSFSF